MNIQKYFFSSIICCMICFPLTLKSQNVCTQVLKNAQETYDAGRLNGIPAMLEDCLQEGFIRSEKISALRLLTLTYLFQDEDQLAAQTLLQLFKEDPEYKTNEVLDPAEFIYLYKKYRSVPVVSVGLWGGLNQSRVNLDQKFSTENTEESHLKYTPGIGYQFGLVADILLYKKLQMNTGLLFSGKKYEMTSEKMFDYTTLHLIESQSWLELPVTLKYNLGQPGKRKLIPFVHAGAAANFFLSSSGNITRVSIANDNDASGPAVKMKNLRNKLNFSAIIGAGIRYKIGYGYALLDVRYHWGLANVINTKNRYSNNELIYYYGYIDSDYRLNNISVSVGYLKSLYKTKKNKVKND